MPPIDSRFATPVDSASFPLPWSGWIFTCALLGLTLGIIVDIAFRDRLVWMISGYNLFHPIAVLGHGWFAGLLVGLSIDAVFLIRNYSQVKNWLGDESPTWPGQALKQCRQSPGGRLNEGRSRRQVHRQACDWVRLCRIRASLVFILALALLAPGAWIKRLTPADDTATSTRSEWTVRAMPIVISTAETLIIGLCTALVSQFAIGLIWRWRSAASIALIVPERRYESRFELNSSQQHRESKNGQLQTQTNSESELSLEFDLDNDERLIAKPKATKRQTQSVPVFEPAPKPKPLSVPLTPTPPKPAPPPPPPQELEPTFGFEYEPELESKSSLELEFDSDDEIPVAPTSREHSSTWSKPNLDLTPESPSSDQTSFWISIPASFQSTPMIDATDDQLSAPRHDPEDVSFDD